MGSWFSTIFKEDYTENSTESYFLTAERFEKYQPFSEIVVPKTLELKKYNLFIKNDIFTNKSFLPTFRLLNQYIYVKDLNKIIEGYCNNWIKLSIIINRKEFIFLHVLNKNIITQEEKIEYQIQQGFRLCIKVESNLPQIFYDQSFHIALQLDFVDSFILLGNPIKLIK